MPKTMEERIYYLAVRRCKRTHAELFTDLVHRGIQPGGFCAPCRDCRNAVHKEVENEHRNKRTPWVKRREKKSRKKTEVVAQVNKWLVILGHL